MIEFKDVTKKFDGGFALDKVSLTIDNGTAFGLLGTNGAGKSTLLRMAAGIYRPDEGKVLVDGQLPESASVKEKSFFINDETVQFGEFTPLDLKRYYKGYYSGFSEELWNKLIKTVDIPVNKKLDTFSKGMKRQTIVITGLACGTNHLLMDEAFDGLDPAMRIIVKRMIVDAMLDRGLTAVISSHNLKEISELCDKAALIHKGKLLFCRGLDSLRDDMVKVQAVFPKEYNSREDFQGLDILHFEKSGSVYFIIAKNNENEIRQALAEKAPTALDIIPLSLEEIFIYEMEGLGYDINSIG